MARDQVLQLRASAEQRQLIDQAAAESLETGVASDVGCTFFKS